MADQIPLHKIRPNPQQPRQQFDPATLMELARSIHHNGLILPIAVEAEENSNRYILHDGERRWRAVCALAIAHHHFETVVDPDSGEFLMIAEMIARHHSEEILDEFHDALELWDIRAEVGDPGTSPQDLKIRAVVANEQRDDLTDIDRARAYQDLHDDGMSDADIATRVGKSRSSIANLRRLLNLPDLVQAQVASGELSQRQALALAPFHALPEPIKEKIAGGDYPNRTLANPGDYTSDQIRAAVDLAVNHRGHDLGTVDFPLDQSIGDDENIVSLACDGCKFRTIVNYENRCFDQACRHAKHRAWTRAELIRAGQVTGIPIHKEFIPHNEYTEFNGHDTDHDAARDHAIETKCDRLVLCRTTYKNTSRASPEGFPYAIYTCHHGRGVKCACLAHVKQEEIQAEKKIKAQFAALRAQVRAALRPIVQQIDPALAVAICGTLTYGSLPSPEQAHTNLVNKLLDNINDYTTDPAQFERNIREWFQERGLVLKSPQDLANDQARDHLAKIRRWMNTTDANTVDLKAVNGNIENLKRLQAENTDDALADEIQMMLDALTHIIIDRQAEASITDRLDEIEADLNDPDIDINGAMMDLEEILDEAGDDHRQRIIDLMDRCLEITEAA